MAIGIFKSLIFGDVNSADYGIYITGEAVYNAPERAVEMVTVPGRNGAIALDQGRWENIEVSYPAGCFGGDQSDFASKISEFRNAIVSQIGYQRLTDEYNPNEYRMAVYAEGLDVKPKSKGRAGEFTITFDCKPQRYLTSGETEITVESGDILTNPTQYESSPLLMVEGYGAIGFNGFEIEIENAVLGKLVFAEEKAREFNGYVYLNRDNNYPLLLSGDTITVKESVMEFEISDQTAGFNVTSFSALSETGSIGGTASASIFASSNLRIMASLPAVTFTKGTSATLTDTVAVTVVSQKNSTTHTETVYIDVSIVYNHVRDTYATIRFIATMRTATNFHGYTQTGSVRGEVYGYSTLSILGHPIYIDCDLGECYKIEDGKFLSLNGKIALGSDLPELASGSNAITYDNTITELKVIPRWWKL